MSGIRELRYWLSVVLTEVPDYLVKLSRKNQDWLYLTNSKQKAISAPQGDGICLLDEYTSQLRAPALFPKLSVKVFNKALDTYDFCLSNIGKKCQKPLVSFIIGHRGKDKLSHLNAVIQSIAGQSYNEIECIVVEQSSYPEAIDHLPDWVSYYHLKTDDTDLYNRSLSFNHGVSKSTGKFVVLHDNDLLIPSCYTKSHVEFLQCGFDVANLKRFIFGFSKKDTDKIFADDNVDRSHVPEYVLQNAKGGGSLFIKKAAYQEIGGFDERFIGWGGEDNEFWQRAQVLDIYPFSCLPMIHLWHAPQPDKRGGESGGGTHTEALLNELSEDSIYNRIEALKALNR